MDVKEGTMAVPVSEYLAASAEEKVDLQNMVLLQHGDDQWEKFLHLTFEYSIKMSHSAPSSIIRPDPWQFWT